MKNVMRDVAMNSAPGRYRGWTGFKLVLVPRIPSHVSWNVDCRNAWNGPSTPLRKSNGLREVRRSRATMT